MPYTINIPNTGAEIKQFWQAKRAVIIPWLIVAGLAIVLLWMLLRPTKLGPKVKDTAEYKELLQTKQANEQAYKALSDTATTLRIQLAYAQSHRDTVSKEIKRYETSYYPVGPTPYIIDNAITDYLKRHGKREAFGGYRIDTTR